MPAYNRPPALWLSDRMARTEGSVISLTKQGTEYIVDEEQHCVAILGAIDKEPDGTSTGLSGFGIAVRTDHEGEWFALPATPPDAANWTPLRLSGVWVPVPGRNEPAYLKDPLGFVHLRGSFAGGASGAPTFTLPAGYRPGGEPGIHPIAGNGSTSPPFLYLTSVGFAAAFYSGVGELALDSVTYLAEN